MFRKILNRLALPPVILLLIMNSHIFAGVSGKISGVVIDSSTELPVEGASIQVAGTSLSTMTDMDGEYFIIDVPIGKYDVIVSYVGYETILQQEVRILGDLTTPLDFNVNSTEIVLSKEIIVSAVNPIIQKDLTSSKIIFTSDHLKALPNIVTIQSILTNYPGVVVDANNALHVRGGRAGQVLYYFDGFSVQDPFIANVGMRIMPSALEELSLTSGGYSAEYGEALSGVVNAVTREGGSSYHGGFKAYQGMTHQYDVTKGTWDNLNFTSNKSGTFNLSGPIPGLNSNKYTFFSAGEYLKDPSYLPANWNISYTGVAKLSLHPIPKMKIKTNLSYYTMEGRMYNHRDQNGISYDFNLDGLPKVQKESYLIGLSGNYHFNERIILSTVINQFYTNTLSAPAHLINTHWSAWPGYSENEDGLYNGTIHEDNYRGTIDFTDPLQTVGFTVGSDFVPRYSLRESKYSSFKTTMVNQVNKFHQLKTGFEYRKYAIEWDNKQFYNANPYGEQYKSNPILVSGFIQDKIEQDYFVVNVGIRFDYHNADISYNATPRDTVISYKKADSKTRFSPRLGISFPISEKSMMHFNYGLYFQEPRYTYVYTNLEGDLSTGYPLLGNPDLQPEQTVSYEIGLDHLVGENLRVDLTAYYKDIKELVTTRSSYQVAGNNVTYYTNDDYGTVKGFDVSLQKLPNGNYLSGSFAYSYMMAQGNGSDALEPYYTYLTSLEDTLAPLTKYPLDFDQRHTLTGLLTLEIPQEWSGRMLGMKVPGAWGVSVVGSYGSGLPYTATDASGNRFGDRNESRLPTNYTIDMRFHKEFYLNKNKSSLSFFMEVDNLFDKRNILNVYSRTGQPDDDGIDVGAGLSLNQQEVNFFDNLYDHNPQNFSAPRTVRTGIEFNF